MTLPPPDPTRDRFVVLPDGRRLAYQEFGDPNGRAVFLLHGLPGSRLQRHHDDTIAERLGLRVVMPDRPGCGLSEFHDRRTILDWPADISTLADALGVERFALGAWSGGAPYAAACAVAMPDRVLRLGLVSPMAPLDGPDALEGTSDFVRRGLRLVQKTPYLVRPTLAVWWRVLHSKPEEVADRIAARLAPSDRRLFAAPALRERFIGFLLDGSRQGPKGPARELSLLAGPWGFDPGEIRVPVHLWHGESDRNVPISMGRRLAQRIPGCQTTWIPWGGHFVAFYIWEQVLRWLAGEPAGPIPEAAPDPVVDLRPPEAASASR